MRLYLTLTKNKENIPFNYQHLLTGAIHKWIGRENKEHGDVSLYSFSWLQKVSTNNKGIALTKDSYFFISAFKEQLLKNILMGILENPSVCCGSQVFAAQICQTPDFGRREHFLLGSPVFIKRRFEDREVHIVFDNEFSGKYLTETLVKKLAAARLPNEGVSIEFDKTYPNPHTKLIRYKEIRNRTNICPIIIEGSPEQIAFAWDVGIGNSTGIGFGALK